MERRRAAMRRQAIAAALALGLAAAAQAQSAPAGSQAAPLEILVYTPQGQPMALTPVPAPLSVQRGPLRALIEDSIGKVVVVRHSAQPAIPLQGGGALLVESIAVFEPGYEQQRLFGIRVTVGRPELPESERAFYLEPRDVDSVSHAVDALEGVAGSAVNNATDAEFQLPEGLGFGFRTVNGHLERVVRASRGSTQRFVLPADGLTRVRDALEAARQNIFGG
jgi:hypothetical protein